MFRSDSEDIEQLTRRVRDGVSKLKGLEVGDELGVEILSQLVDGRKNTSEIVELIYGLSKGDEGFRSSYGRVRREIRRLESKGLISRNLFGQEKSCRLTDIAVINLARIGRGEKQQSLLPRTDLAAYLVTLALSVSNILLAMDLLQLADLPTFTLLTSFCFFLGISFYGSVRMIRRVF